MSTEIQDVLTANMVLVGVDLLNTPESVNAFRLEIDSEVSSGLPHGSINNGDRYLTISKHRISLSLAPDRSMIEREYPSRNDLPMLAEVAQKAMYFTDVGEQHEIRALGYNVRLVYQQDSGLSAAEYLSMRIFRGNLPGNEKWTLKGGSAKMTFGNGDRDLNVTIEPRFNDPGTEKVYLGLNLHSTEQRLPEKNEVQDSLEEAWDEAEQFIRHLDDIRQA